MSKGKIRVEYCRVDEGYSCTIWTQMHPEYSDVCELRLWGVPFATMMNNLAKVARRLIECEAIILKRTEAPNEYAMAPSEIAQLINDPAAAIRSMREPDRVVIVRDLKGTNPTPKERELVHPSLRAGHDTLADAFGDRIYCRLQRGGSTECPGCGRWHGQPVNAYGISMLKCRCGFGLPYRELIPTADGGWMVFDTSVLLQSIHAKFFLPRGWNESGPWISHADLKQKYETFCKERDDVESSR